MKLFSYLSGIVFLLLGVLPSSALYVEQDELKSPSTYQEFSSNKLIAEANEEGEPQQWRENPWSVCPDGVVDGHCRDVEIGGNPCCDPCTNIFIRVLLVCGDFESYP